MFRLASALKVRPGEGALVLRFVTIMLVGLFGAALGAAAVESLFFSRFGPHVLPTLYVVLGFATFLVMTGMSALLGRPDAHRTLGTILAVLAVVLVAGRAALLLGLGWVYPVLWVVMMIVWTAQVMASWALAGAVHETRQAKRLFPLYGVGLILGGIGGGAATGPLAAWLGTENLILLWAAALVSVWALARTVAGRGALRRRRPRASIARETARAFREVSSTPLLRWLSLALALFALLYFTLSLRFAEAATERFPRTEELAAFLGGFLALVNAVALVLSLFVASRLFGRFGVPVMVLALAGIYVVGFALLLVASGFAVVVGFRFVQMIWVNGVWGTGWQALYNVVPSDGRARVRSFMDAGPLQAGIVLSGLLLLVGERLLPAAAVSALGVVAALAALWAMWRAREAYGGALETALREGNPDVFGPEEGPLLGPAWDAEATAKAVAGASSRDPAVRRVSVDVLSRLDAPATLPILLEALGDPDAEVRAAALRGVARFGDRSALDAVRPLLGDPEPRVRGEAVEAVRALGPGEVAPVRGLLSDPDPEVAAKAAAALLAAGVAGARSRLVEMTQAAEPARRRAALQALAAAGAEPDLVLGGLSDPDPSVRRAAARVAASLDPGVGTAGLLEALRDPHPSVRDAAAASLVALQPPDRHAVRSFVEREIAAASRYHELWRALGPDRDARLALLSAVVRDESLRRARIALRAAAASGDPGALDLAVSSLESRDQGQRANALEMLEAVGPRAVVRPLVALWEGSPDARADRGAALRRLTIDPDPWIRACATYAEAVPSTGGTTMETLTTLSTMDRVLFLRKVPLFADLSPRDVGRIAEVATEHAFRDGEVLAEQGEQGDEMHVVVAGEIRAIVEEDDGARTEVGRRGPGDYVGEMAIITDQPRMASLVCAGDVRTLAIDRKRFERILTDRPEASLAVMRVLCDRLREAHGQRPSPI